MLVVVSQFLAIDQDFVIAFIAVIISGVLRGYSGFGAALIIIPIFSNLYSPLTALSFHVLIEMPTLLVLLPTVVKIYDRKLINSSLFYLVTGVPFGFYLTGIIETAYLQLFIGYIVVISALLIWHGVPLAFANNRRFFHLVSAMSGISQGLVGLGGPPVVTTLMSRQDDGVTARANIIVVLSVLLIVSLISQITAEAITWLPIILALKLFFFYMLSNQLGKWLFFRYAQDIHRKVALFFLVLIGVHSIFVAFNTL